MAKLILQRFPDPRPEYDAQQSAELIRQLEEMIQQLNTNIHKTLKRSPQEERGFLDRWLTYLKGLHKRQLTLMS